MKAILVIDEMPTECSACPCFREGWDIVLEHCSATDLPFENTDKPSWCPLKPLPKIKPMTKADHTYNPWEDTYRRGWNACLEEIEDGER